MSQCSHPHHTEFELQEAQLEIERHHNDFQTIQDILNAYEQNLISSGEACKKVRMVVG